VWIAQSRISHAWPPLSEAKPKTFSKTVVQTKGYPPDCPQILYYTVDGKRKRYTINKNIEAKKMEAKWKFEAKWKQKNWFYCFALKQSEILDVHEAKQREKDSAFFIWALKKEALRFSLKRNKITSKTCAT
jgi:hypothetical protein